MGVIEGFRESFKAQTPASDPQRMYLARFLCTQDQMRAFKRHLTAASRDQPQKLTTKKAQERVDAMLSIMDVNLGRKPMAASAA